MHANRLLRLAKEVSAELLQKVKESEEFPKSTRKLAQACPSMELLEQVLRIHTENFDEKINSIRLVGEKRKNYIRLARKCIDIINKSRGVSGNPAGDCSQILPSPAVPAGAACSRKADVVSSIPASCMGESDKVSVQQDLEGEIRESHRICQTVLCPEPLVEDQVELVDNSASQPELDSLPAPFESGLSETRSSLLKLMEEMNQLLKNLV